MTNLKQQAKLLKMLRKQKGFTQGKLGYLIGVTQPAIAYYEKNGVTNVAIASKLAIALGTDLEIFRV